MLKDYEELATLDGLAADAGASRSDASGDNPAAAGAAERSCEAMT